MASASAARQEQKLARRRRCKTNYFIPLDFIKAA
jgi:hypothetical protein